MQIASEFQSSATRPPTRPLRPVQRRRPLPPIARSRKPSEAARQTTATQCGAFVDVEGTALEDKIAFLKVEIYLKDIEPRLQTLTAFNRFSVRS